jgi:hypothetical protein
MRSIRNWQCVGASVFIVAILAGTACVPGRPRTPTTQTSRAAGNPDVRQTTTFPAHATLGPALPIPETEIDGRTAYRCDVHGPVWDGVNNGLWLVLQDRTNQDSTGQPECTAILIDPVSGKEKRHRRVPVADLVGHDGVGLWFQLNRDNKRVFQRIRTAQTLASGQQMHERSLPEDLPAIIASDSFGFSRQEPVPSLFGMPVTVARDGVIGGVDLTCWFFDSRTVSLYGGWKEGGAERSGNHGAMVTGAGYLWVLADGLQRIPLSQLKPLQTEGSPSSKRGQVLRNSEPFRLAGRKQISSEESVALARGSLAWDGQRLWSLDKQVSPRKAEGEPNTIDRRPDTTLPPIHLVCIDVGLARKPDTTERHNKALAFERKNGTLKAIPLFEQIIADDPAAAEVRNHLGWALATRPQEPYHDIQRAKKLVEGALEWQPWDPEKWDTLAEIYWRLGDAKLAERLEAKAINLNPNKTFYWRQLDKFRSEPGTDKAPEPAY